MAFSLPLPAHWTAQGWKVKIRDRERLEPPHVTLLLRAKAWRWNLRDGGFMDSIPDPRDVPPELVDFVVQNVPQLQAEWEAMYPDNPIAPHGSDE